MKMLLIPAVCLTLAALGRADSAPTPQPVPAIPGRIEAEDYDEFFDTTPGNTGGVYRADDVDLEYTGDAGGGYNVGWIASGEWLTFPVNVLRAGTYMAVVRVAAHFAGTRKFRIEVDGVNQTGSVAFNLSAGWQVYSSVLAKDLDLTAGQHEIRFVAETGGFNLNWIELEPYVPVPGRVEAENYKSGGEGVAYHDTSVGNYGGAYRTDDVDLQPTSDTGGGHNVGWMVQGEWLSYFIHAAEPTTLDVTARVSSAISGTKSFHLEIDGVNVSGTLSFAPTGGWQTFVNVTKTGVPIAAGFHTLKVVAESSHWNLNYVDVGTPPAGNPNFVPLPPHVAPVDPTKLVFTGPHEKRALFPFSDTEAFGVTLQEPFRSLALQQISTVLDGGIPGGGSANHVGSRLTSALVYLYRYGGTAQQIQNARDMVKYFYDGQIGWGHLRFANRDETGAPGYCNYHEGSAYLALWAVHGLGWAAEETMVRRWIRAELALNRLWNFEGRVYSAGKRTPSPGVNKSRDHAYDLLTKPGTSPIVSLLGQRNVSGTVANRAAYYAYSLVQTGLWQPAAASFTHLPAIAGNYHVRRGHDNQGAWYLCTVDSFQQASAGDYTHFGVLVRHGGIMTWWTEVNAGTHPQTSPPWGSTPAGTYEHWIGNLGGWQKIQ